MSRIINHGMNNSVPTPLEKNHIKSSILSSVFYGAIAGVSLLSTQAFAIDVTPETCADRPVTSTPALVAQGRDLFKHETFGGNGRTCETCHRENRNFTIDADFIATLSPSDPLFVNETNPALRDLENSQMLRQFGLICENLDGLDKPCVFRSVPHTLGMSQTMGIGVTDAVTGKSVHETGWSSDGTPGDGSLRCFALGAIIQHFPKTMNREPGVDFRLPTEEELDAMLAFQLSLGRQQPLDVPKLNFLDARAQAGKALFFGAIPTRRNNGLTNLDTRNCSGCHVQAGANNNNTFAARNRVTNVNFAPTAPACIAQANPSFGLLANTLGDGGFGKDQTQTFSDFINCATGPVLANFAGDAVLPTNLKGFFNVPSLHEAADTGPFFHNNAFDTLEGAINFYSSDEFNNSMGNVGRAFNFGPNDVNNLGIFLRTLNAIENARSASAYIDQSSGLSTTQAKEMLALALADVDDGIRVLTTGPLANSGIQPGANGKALRDAILAFRACRNQLNAAINQQSNNFTVAANNAKTALRNVRDLIVSP